MRQKFEQAALYVLVLLPFGAAFLMRRPQNGPPVQVQARQLRPAVPAGQIDTDGLVWIFDRTEKLGDAVQSNVIRQGIVLLAAAAYLRNSDLREGVSKLLNFSAEAETGRSLLFELAIPLLLLYLFISLGYQLALYLAARDALRRNFTQSDLMNRGRMPYENGSLATLIVAFVYRAHWHWETFIGEPIPPPASFKERFRAHPLNKVFLAFPYLVLTGFALAIWVGNNIVFGFFLADRFNGEQDRVLIYVALMVLLIPFYAQFLTTPLLSMGWKSIPFAFAVWATATVLGVLILHHEPCQILKLYVEGSQGCP